MSQMDFILGTAVKRADQLASNAVDRYFGILKLLFSGLCVPCGGAGVSAGSRSDWETIGRRRPSAGPVLAAVDPFSPGWLPGRHLES